MPAQANHKNSLRNFIFEIERFKAGDKQNFKIIFDSLYPNLCLFISRFIHNLPAAEDLTQECFVTLWDHREKMESAQHIKSFLYFAARNTALDFLRHEKIRNQYTEQSIQQLETSENFIHFVIAEEVEQILLKTEENLPQQCKQIFILAMQGKGNEEIAAQLHISVNTVKTQKKIAYKKLKHFISEISTILLFFH